jgi:hypothetical protein
MKFSMSEAWNDATAMMSANREVLLVVAGIFFLLPSLAVALAIPGVQESMMADPENASAAITEVYANWWWLLILVVLAQLVGYLAMLALLRDTSRPTVGEALKTGLAGLLPAIGVYLVIAVAIAAVGIVIALLATVSPPLGILVVLLAMIVGVYAMVKLSLTWAVIAIDKVSNPLGAIARSWRLTKGNSLRLFLFILLLALVYLVVSIVVAAVLGLVFALAGPSTAALLNGIVSGLIGAAFTVVFVAVIAAVHRQLAGPSAEAVSATFE